MLFNLFLNDLDDVQRTLSKFANDTELGGVAGTPAGCVATWMNFDRLEQRPDRSLVVFK